MGTVSIAGQPPDRPQGKVNVFLGLGANFYSLKQRGRVASGDWLEHSRVSTGIGIFA